MSNPFIKTFHDDNKDPINILNDIDLYFNNCSWLSDAETMKDLYLLDKDNFLNKYRYISSCEYDLMKRRVKF